MTGNGKRMIGEKVAKWIELGFAPRDDVYFIRGDLKEWLPVRLATAESKDFQLSGVAEGVPVRLQTSHSLGGGEGGARGGNSQAATEGNAIEDFDHRAAFDG
jgi:hypothetical protein